MIPTACTQCRRSFGDRQSGAGMAVLEGDFALCDSCDWLIDHPEAGATRPSANIVNVAPLSVE